MVETKSLKLTPNFPTDLCEDILSFLPVKSLLRFLSVSKTWRSLIEDHRFVKSYGNQPKSDSHIVHSKPSGEIQCSINCRQTLRVRVNGRHRFKYSGEWNIIGSAEGLFLLESRVKEYKNDLLWSDQLLLWNPSIRRHRILPQIPPVLEDGVTINAGLGFDPSVQDYKHVRFVYQGDFKEMSSILVYTLGTNSWKTIPIKSNGWYFDWNLDCESVCFRGSLYFLALTFPTGTYKMVSYDLRREDFTAVKLPTVCYGGYVSYWALRCTRDGHSLAIAEMWGNIVRIWSGEGEGTWIKHCAFASEFPMRMFDRVQRLRNVLSIDLQARVVLVGLEDCVTLYDLDTRKEKMVVRKPTALNYKDEVRVTSYVESLVLLN